MLLKDDKKKMVTTIIGKLGRPEMEKAPEKDGVEQDDSIGLESCADEIIQAVEEKSPKKLVEAMRSMMEMLDEDNDEQENQEEEPQEKPEY